MSSSVSTYRRRTRPPDSGPRRSRGRTLRSTRVSCPTDECSRGGRLRACPRSGHRRRAAVPPGTFVSIAEPVDLFCSGLTFLSDGRLFTAGGHSGINNQGILASTIFNFATNSWTTGPNMANGRWYPSNTTLPSGEVADAQWRRHRAGDESDSRGVPDERPVARVVHRIAVPAVLSARVRHADRWRVRRWSELHDVLPRSHGHRALEPLASRATTATVTTAPRSCTMPERSSSLAVEVLRPRPR